VSRRLGLKDFACARAPLVGEVDDRCFRLAAVGTDLMNEPGDALTFLIGARYTF